MRSLFRSASILALAGALAACTIRGPLDGCGEWSEDGGPMVLRTKEHEMCELGRLALKRYMESRETFTGWDADKLASKVRSWTGEESTDALVERVRKGVGDELAAPLARSIAFVKTKSTRPHDAECTDPDRCLAEAAANGMVLASRFAQDYTTDRIPLGGPPPGPDDDDVLRDIMEE